jgi:hypothetical protein
MQICYKLVQVSSSGNVSMRDLSQSAFLILGLLVIGLASSTLTHSVSGLNIQDNTAEPVASKISLTAQNVAQIYSPTISNPFEEIQKMNFSNVIISQDKHLSNAQPDVNSIKYKIKSDIKNHFKLPIDIPFP